MRHIAIFAALLALCRVSVALLDLSVAQSSAGSFYSGFSTCSLFTPPASPILHFPTCGLSLIHYNSSEILTQSLACSEGPANRTALQAGSTVRTAKHGRDLFILELSRGGRVRSRLGGLHVGHGRYVFPGWRLLSPGPWNASFLLWATARPALLHGAAAQAPNRMPLHAEAVTLAGNDMEAGAVAKRNQKQDAAAQPHQSPSQQPQHAQPQPHTLPLGFNALLHTDFLWQLQHRYVETTPLRPPVLVVQLHKGQVEQAGHASSASAANRSGTAATGSRASAHEQQQLDRHHSDSRRQARTARRRQLQSMAGVAAGATHSPATVVGPVLADGPRAYNTSSSSRNSGHGGAVNNMVMRPLCHEGAAKGEWVRIPDGARDCPPGVCTGALSPLLYGSPDNLAIDFHDVYVPYSCQYRLYTPDEAAACLDGRRLVLVGDSRAHELAWYLSLHYPGVHVHHQLLLPYRVGLRALLAAEAQRNQQLEQEKGQQQQQQQAGAATTATAAAAAAAAAPGGGLGLRELMMGYEVLVLSSELHDIADYDHAAPDYLQPYGLDPGPPCLRVSVAAAAATTNSSNNSTASNTANSANCNGSRGPRSARAGGTAEAVHPGGAPTGAQCAPDTPERAQLPKWRPVAQYLDALSQLVTVYKELRAELQQAGLLRVRRVLWLLPGYRPAATPACLPNQLERMLCLQQWELGQVAGQAGWEVVDLGTMAQDGPAAWWSDDVHVSGARSGHKRTHSGLQVMQLQALFNVLCNQT